MKILFITDGIFPYVIGGMQKHSTNLIKNLSTSGVDVSLFHTLVEGEIPSENDVNQFLFGDKKEFYINVTCLKFPKSLKFPGHYIYNSKKYSNSIYFSLSKSEINDFDFIYAKGFTSWRFLLEKKKGNKLPPIGVNFHGYEMWQYAPDFKSKLIQFLFRPFVKWNNLNADYVFSYGAKITEIICSIGVNKGNVIEIPSAIDESWIRKPELPINNEINFLFLGRYERRKGIEELNKAINLLNEKELNIKFHFIGPIPSEKRLNYDNVIYYGGLNDFNQIKAIMECCDILLCPSFAEGMPNVILEAMASGLAIIANDVGAVSLMVNSENGILLNEISPEILMKSIISIINIPDNELNSMKLNSINKIVELFTWSKIIRQFNDVVKTKI